MVDNVVLSSGTGGGSTIAADEVATGVLHQRVKVQFGASGSAGDVHSGNPLPVTVSGISQTVTVTGASLANISSTVSGTHQAVVVDTALPAGTNKIGAVTVSGNVSINGTAGEGSALPSVFVVIAGDDGTDTQPLQTTVTGFLKTKEQGTITVTGSSLANLGSTVSGSHQAVVVDTALPAGSNTIGAFTVSGYAHGSQIGRGSTANQRALVTGTSETTFLSAGGAGVFNDLTFLTISNLSTGTTARVDIRPNTASGVILTYRLAENGGGMVAAFNPPLEQNGSNVPWTITASGSTAVAITANAVQRT